VLGRKLAENSIPGSLELTELLMVVVIFAALPLVSERGEHVEFDSLDPTCRPGCAGCRPWWCTCCAPRC
jgi:TRAP-type C4-dicarboxylate transport system permease small subunit